MGPDTPTATATKSGVEITVRTKRGRGNGAGRGRNVPDGVADNVDATSVADRVDVALRYSVRLAEYDRDNVTLKVGVSVSVGLTNCEFENVKVKVGVGCVTVSVYGTVVNTHTNGSTVVHGCDDTLPHRSVAGQYPLGSSVGLCPPQIPDGAFAALCHCDCIAVIAAPRSTFHVSDARTHHRWPRAVIPLIVRVISRHRCAANV